MRNDVLIRMTKGDDALSVHPTCEAAHAASGWTRAHDQEPKTSDIDAPDPLDHDGDGKRGGSKPKDKKALPSVNGDGTGDALPEINPANPGPHASGLSRTEVEADLTAMGVDFDPTQTADELLALRDEARAIRDA